MKESDAYYNKWVTSVKLQKHCTMSTACCGRGIAGDAPRQLRRLRTRPTTSPFVGRLDGPLNCRAEPAGQPAQQPTQARRARSGCAARQLGLPATGLAGHADGAGLAQEGRDADAETLFQSAVKAGSDRPAHHRLLDIPSVSLPRRAFSEVPESEPPGGLAGDLRAEILCAETRQRSHPGIALERAASSPRLRLFLGSSLQ